MYSIKITNMKKQYSRKAQPFFKSKPHVSPFLKSSTNIHIHLNIITRDEVKFRMLTKTVCCAKNKTSFYNLIIFKIYHWK